MEYGKHKIEHVLWLLTRFGSSAVALLSFLFYELWQAVPRHTKLQAAVPALFYFLFWQQCLLFSLVAGVALFASFMPAVGCALFGADVAACPRRCGGQSMNVQHLR